MNCSRCESLKISTIIYDSKKIIRCWGCGFVLKKKVDCPDHSKSQVKPKLDGAKKAMSGADAVDEMESEE